MDPSRSLSHYAVSEKREPLVRKLWNPFGKYKDRYASHSTIMAYSLIDYYSAPFKTGQKRPKMDEKILSGNK